MTGKVSVVIEQDEHGCYAWCPELKGCQSQGKTVEETLTNIREAIELFLETLTDEERALLPERQPNIHALARYSAEEIEYVMRESAERLCGYVAGEPYLPPRSRRAALVGVLLAAISPLMAQSGGVRIRVTDATGAVVPGAEVSLLDNGDKPQQTGHANDAGEVVFTNVPTGNQHFTVTSRYYPLERFTVKLSDGNEAKVEALLLLKAGDEVYVAPVRTNPPIDARPEVVFAGRTIEIPYAVPADPLPLVSQPQRKHKRWWIFR